MKRLMNLMYSYYILYHPQMTRQEWMNIVTLKQVGVYTLLPPTPKSSHYPRGQPCIATLVKPKKIIMFCQAMVFSEKDARKQLFISIFFNNFAYKNDISKFFLEISFWFVQQKIRNQPTKNKQNGGQIKLHLMMYQQFI